MNPLTPRLLSLSVTRVWMGAVLTGVLLAACSSPPDAPTAKTVVAAARAGDEERALKLLGHGADPDEKDEGGRTAIMYAGANCLSQLALELIRKGANLNMKDTDGQTALMHAAAAPCLAVTELLLQNGARKTLKDNAGKTAKDHAEAAKQAGGDAAAFDSVLALL